MDWLVSTAVPRCICFSLSTLLTMLVKAWREVVSGGGGGRRVWRETRLRASQDGLEQDVGLGILGHHIHLGEQRCGGADGVAGRAQVVAGGEEEVAQTILQARRHARVQQNLVHVHAIRAGLRLHRQVRVVVAQVTQAH